ncbi:SMP-30/gluconolactonase/LRE family protein [Akkermansiaceae bacterium]|nr:SMP-30/gluconolactonase/LRE family protein [Akkermansiaceae bacterium]
MTIETIGNYRAQWGEGPIWWEGRLIYVDIEKHQVIFLDPATGEEVFFDVGERVGTVVPREAGGVVIAGDHGFSFLDTDSGKVSRIADPEPEKLNNRFNDGKCSPDGHFFAGTISLVKEEGDAALYRLSSDLGLSKAFGPVTNSNGIVWTQDGSTVFYIDTPRKAVLQFDYEDGTLSNPREVISTQGYEASPDGMAIDESGHLWIAFCHGSCVICYDPQSGNELRKIELPCMETTAVAFGGENMDELYVTTGIHKSEVEADAGRLFRITGLGVRGLAAHAFAG